MHWKDSLPDWYVKKYGHQPCVNIGTAGHVDHVKTSLFSAVPLTIFFNVSYNSVQVIGLPVNFRI